ncbi:hypothetical protein AXI64_gp014 [Vibrio phage qdvp001]|uniref:hypothetical protein n=1 Tax=Vibrio phage qdvp001 TaxID=1003177 RepID=UPI0007227D12|nr:hypothetical protein AXI64_gp014 [Vibrio phage qdvp001]ALM62006.1 hypothetical protein qdvp001_014 [Vibrio phage qdvp001]
MNLIFERDDWNTDHEIIIKFKNNKFDWIDPIVTVYEDDEKLVVENERGYTYDYSLDDIEKYRIRVYNSEDIYDVEG